jgi:Ca-activated chloride channel homolog
VRFRWVPVLLRTAALALLIIGLARPQTVDAEFTETEGIDIALVLDFSGSMISYRQDGETLLSIAERISKEFVEGLVNDRVSLSIFRSETMVMSPLTSDYQAISEMIDMAADLPLRDGTAIGHGVSDGLETLRHSRAQGRAIILMTDGENNAGEIEPLVAARMAEAIGVHLYTIGLMDQRTIESGRTNVDEIALQEMAELTGGQYFPATTPDLLAEVYASIAELERSRLDDSVVNVLYRELAPFFIFAAMALVVLEVAATSTIWRRLG